MMKQKHINGSSEEILRSIFLLKILIVQFDTF
jgi:hypothetical protein